MPHLLQKSFLSFSQGNPRSQGGRRLSLSGTRAGFLLCVLVVSKLAGDLRKVFMNALKLRWDRGAKKWAGGKIAVRGQSEGICSALSELMDHHRAS
jgi:hypothetical protein